MITIQDVAAFLEDLAPSSLAAEWDNVGLLVGDKTQSIERVMTCLTVTPAVAEEAVRERAGLIVTHHPLPFQPLKRLTTDEPAGRLLLQLIRAGIAIYSPHTRFDSASEGINQQLATGLGLLEIKPLVPRPLSGDAPKAAANLGDGRYGRFAAPTKLADVASRLKQFLKISGLHMVGDDQRPIERAAVACGSAGEFLTAALEKGCQLLVTGETRLHTCYEAEARGITLLLAGHYASERFGIENLAAVLQAKFPAAKVWASRDERDPLLWR